MSKAHGPAPMLPELSALGLAIVNGCRGPGPSGGGCERPPAGHGADGLCSSHLKQYQRTGRLSAIQEPRTPLERVIDTGSAMLEADAENDAEWHRRLSVFKDACERWLLALGWQPPREIESSPAPTVSAAAPDDHHRGPVEVPQEQSAPGP